MNDLAEKALTGLTAATRAVRSRPLSTLGTLGFGVSCVVVVAGSRVSAAGPTHPLSSWLGLLSLPDSGAGAAGPGTVLVLALVAMCLLWLATVEAIRRSGAAPRPVWGVFAAWAVPLLVGPPLFDTSVYGYTAFGLLQRAGARPYDVTPNDLGFSRVVEAVDPGLRGVPNGLGPLGALIEHLAVSVSGGTAVLAVLALRGVAVASVVWLGRTAGRMGTRRGRALSLTVLNPLVLCYAVSAARLEALVAALALAAVAAANRRAWVRSVVLGTVAAAVLPYAAVVVAAVVIVHAWPLRGRALARGLAGDVVLAVAGFALFTAAVPDGLGWLHTVSGQFTSHTPFCIADATSRILQPAIGNVATYDTLNTSTRVATVITMVVIIGLLLGTAGRRPLERTVGYVLLAVGLLAPTLYPWYLLPGIVCVAPSSDARRKVVVIGLSVAAVLLMPGGFGRHTTDILTAVELTVVAAVGAASLARLREQDATPQRATR